MTISHSSTPCDILGEMFKLNYKLFHSYYYPTNHTQAGLTSAGPCIDSRWTNLLKGHYSTRCQGLPVLINAMFPVCRMIPRRYSRCSINIYWAIEGKKGHKTQWIPRPPGKYQIKWPQEWGRGYFGGVKGKVLYSKTNSVFEIQTLPLTSLPSLMLCSSRRRTTKKIKRWSGANGGVFLGES